jgi:carboxymethylenebutenolidase
VGWWLWPSAEDIPIEEERTSVVVETVRYFNDVEGYVAAPSAEGKYPGLILIHEWWGLNEDIESLARSFAEEGYVVLAVDMYKGESTDSPDMARELSSGVRADVKGAFENLEAGLAYLKSRADVQPEQLASVGWCFGGGWAYQMAVNDLDIDASVMYYGQFDPEEDFEHMRASILGHFGEEDSGIAINDVREFQANLETANGNHAVYIYPNVGHGFANIRGGTNMAYDEDAATLAWERTRAFLADVFEE